jgi:hypothetical protein
MNLGFEFVKREVPSLAKRGLLSPDRIKFGVGFFLVVIPKSQSIIQAFGS